MPLVAVIAAGAEIAAVDCGVFAVGAAMDAPETDDKTEGDEMPAIASALHATGEDITEPLTVECDTGVEMLPTDTADNASGSVMLAPLTAVTAKGESIGQSGVGVGVTLFDVTLKSVGSAVITDPYGASIGAGVTGVAALGADTVPSLTGVFALGAGIVASFSGVMLTPYKVKIIPITRKGFEQVVNLLS